MRKDVVLLSIMIVNELTVFASLTVRAPQRGLSSVALCATPARPPRPVSLSSVVLLTSNTLPLCFIGLGIHIYTLPPKAYDLQLLAPSVVYLK